MSENFRISRILGRAPSVVFEALTQPAQLESYFLLSASASPLTAREISWRLPEHAPLHLQTSALRLDHLIAFNWRSPELPEPIKIRFELEAEPCIVLRANPFAHQRICRVRRYGRIGRFRAKGDAFYRFDRYAQHSPIAQLDHQIF
ncbi:MAG: hypothetical protein CVV27_00465, partial [Candidatus Melainabacteria bacterium HGW-Melainabacteria-1]